MDIGKKLISEVIILSSIAKAIKNLNKKVVNIK